MRSVTLGYSPERMMMKSRFCPVIWLD